MFWLWSRWSFSCMETRSVPRAIKLVEGVVVLGISWLDVHSFKVVLGGEFRGSTSGGRVVTGRAEVRLVEAEVKPVEVEELLVEEDLDLVEQEKQTKWLAEMMVNNLPDQFSRVLSMHSWSNSALTK